MQHIYLDHAATTPLDEEVFEKMRPYYTEIFGNPNSQHYFGQQSVKAVDEARDMIAKELNCRSSEIYFTSGGTEADNWALRGAALAYGDKGKHIIISAIEHHAMLTTCEELAKQGFEITLAKVDEFGTVDVEALKAAIRPDTIFVGIMMANNEIGTIQPIKEIAQICNEKKIFFFTDCVQAAGVLKLDVKELGVTALSLSAHKFYGPKGIGVLYLKNGKRLGKLISGGHQERAMRGGTTNVPSVVGMAYALKKANETAEENNAYVSSLRDRFISRVLAEIPEVKLNGHPENRLPSNANFSFRYVEGESILFKLDLAGIAVSSGSACSSGSLEPSHVLMAIGLPVGQAHGTIRFSFGKHNTVEEVDYTVETLKASIAKLREMSPLYKKESK